MTNKHLYPDNWPQLRLACLEGAGYRCEHCGIAHCTTLVSERTGNPYIVYLHAAHVHHDIRNPQPQLMALCPSCHGRYDYAYKQREYQLYLERMKHRILLAKPWLQRWYWRERMVLAKV
jgi:5-methylcytosine-specific restriction endonuclease McrA